MVNLILVILSISLTAATLFASLNYMPIWTKQATDSYSVVKTGLVTLDKAFNSRTTADNGVPPAPLAGDDGGLATNFAAYYSFLPKTPQGYAWRYGYNGAAYYFCMYPKAGNVGASEGLWRGLTRLRRVLPDDQYFITSGGIEACDLPTPPTPQSPAVKAPPSAYPALLSVVYLVSR
jgi:hypothetical protein